MRINNRIFLSSFFFSSPFSCCCIFIQQFGSSFQPCVANMCVGVYSMKRESKYLRLIDRMFLYFGPRLASFKPYVSNTHMWCAKWFFQGSTILEIFFFSVHIFMVNFSSYDVGLIKMVFFFCKLNAKIITMQAI